MSKPVMDTLAISQDAQLHIPGWQLRGDYPAGTTAWIVLYGDSQQQVNGQVSNRGIDFMAAPGGVSNVKTGDKFKLFVNYPGSAGAVVERYGTVVRPGPGFPLQATSPTIPSQYSDNFNNFNISSSWIPVGGGGVVEVHKTGSDYSLGPKYSLFNSACVRWSAPLSEDSVTVKVKLKRIGTGKLNVLVCGDYQMNSYVGVQFQSNVLLSDENLVYGITGNGPVTWTRRGTATRNTVQSGGEYTIVYNNSSHTLTCSDPGGNTICRLDDTPYGIRHGSGYRYTGLSWNTDLFTPGVEPTQWSVKDGL